MGTRVRSAQLRTHPRVAQFRAGQARRAARAAASPARELPYRWPADQKVIITATLAAARAEGEQAEAPDG